MIKKITLAFILLVFISFQYNNQLKFPVVLVHGIGFSENINQIKYWNNIPIILREKGANVFLSNHQAMGLIKENAQQLEKRILKVLDITRAHKVNLICHSRGGLEARYLVSKINSDIVASITTIATPHRGSPIADYVYENIDENNYFPNAIVNLFAKMMGDHSPKSFESGKELTTSKMKEFNKQVKNVESIRYFSYAAALTKPYGIYLPRKMYNYIYEKEGDNDCLVSIKSAKWGEFMGTIKKVSHFEVVGYPLFKIQTEFNTIEFYQKIYDNLMKEGF